MRFDYEIAHCNSYTLQKSVLITVELHKWTYFDDFITMNEIWKTINSK